MLHREQEHASTRLSSHTAWLTPSSCWGSWPSPASCIMSRHMKKKGRQALFWCTSWRKDYNGC
jgi:hypothetical protein